MDFEKLGAFYLGKEYDVAAERLLDRLVMYDARDLTTHAVCVGMTGSGKTGLCLSLLEEAALDRVPAIIIDPKGDITNLLLTFPDLAPADFRPWVNADDARRKGLDADAFAAAQAETWKKGLAEWGQDGARIARLKESADFVIYTPGSEAGVPVSILRSFAPPVGVWDDDSEGNRERVQATVGALLGLLGIDADPVKSREHILLSNLLEHFWRAHEELDLPKLILAIQNPPVRRMGVFDVDTFFPEKERFGLAMALNNIIAAPGFQSWLAGQAMDVAGFLAAPDGRPRHSIFYVAHLSDAERMFFVTMLLNQVIAWMRSQPGTTSLRALVYMDEIFGFFPPVANPPSKLPMLTLLKQARAFGLGVVLTTQNPVDLDYKGLTNAGTWFIGRLQTERDKMRVLEGLEGAAAQAGGSLDRGALDRLISSLGNRVFLLHNVHAEAPLTFQTRWAMSYLRGPLTKVQVQTLTAGRSPDGAVAAPSPGVTPGGATGEPTARPPALVPGIRQVFLPARKDPAATLRDLEAREGRTLDVAAAGLLYVPGALGLARVHFTDRKLGVDAREEVNLLARAPGGPERPRWDDAEPLSLDPSELAGEGEEGARFEPLPEGVNDLKDISALADELSDHLLRNRSLTLFYNPALKVYSRPGESERDFAGRLAQEAREARDREVDRIEDKLRGKIAALEAKLQKTEAAQEKKEATAQMRKGEILVSVGETVLGMFLGRRSTRAASTAMSKYRMSKSASMDAEATARQAAQFKEEMARLEEELKSETDAVTKRWEEATAALQPVALKPKRGDVEVDGVVLAWVPFRRYTVPGPGGVTRTLLAAAY